MIYQIKKRDGRIEPFCKQKIIDAICHAMKRAGQDDMAAVKRIADEIAASDGKHPSPKDGSMATVEEIQDMVEMKLMKTSLKQTAKEYITYREKRSQERERNTVINRQIETVIAGRNVQNSNANVDEASFSGRKFESANILHKHISLNAYARPEVSQAHRESRIYLHDLSDYDIGEHNCFRRDTKFITEKGTKSFCDFQDGDQVVVMTHRGNWKQAVVRCAGTQNVNRIMLKRGIKGLPFEVYATPNHRWILRDGSVTNNLSVGDTLFDAPDAYHFDFEHSSEAEKEMWCKGFALGDGTQEYRLNKATGESYKIDSLRVRLCGNKKEFAQRFAQAGYHISSQQFDNGDIIVVKRGENKNIPDVDKLTSGELIALIHGLYDADGCKVQTQMGIQFTNKELCDFVERYFETAGLYISSKRCKTGQETNYGIRKETYDYGFIPYSGHFAYQVKEIVPAGQEEVWCLDVEDDHSFILSGGIPTGNCLFADLKNLLSNGFSTRNGDVRPANSFATACQLVAVIFQCQSQVQFGGVASCHLDYDLVPYVKKSFYKHYRDGMKYLVPDEAKVCIPPDWYDTCIETMASIDHRNFDAFPKVKEYAMDMLEKEGKQAAQGLFHNLNTLESRAGSQVPFSSINYGTDTSVEGRLVTRWLLEASLAGIGKYNLTSIFPISVFKYKKGVNDKPGTPNYDLYQLAVKSLSHRIYPNIVNCDFSGNKEEAGNPDTEMATMGCRTMLGFDRHGLGYSKVGRGNVCPTTMNLPKIGIRHGICLDQRSEPDLDGFWEELDEVLHLTEISLVDRFYHICAQSVGTAPFMYQNGTIAGYKDANTKGVYEAMKHGTLAVGYIGLAEMCQALFGKDHSQDEDVHKFALSVVEHIYEWTKNAADRHNLNFSCYATPAESLCRTYAKALKEEFGVIPNVTDREYITNSHHVPVWQKVSIYKKLQLEAPFCKYATAGCITYIELESSVMNNQEAVEKIVEYAMSLDVPYLAFNFPIDSCLKCGYQGEIEYNCPRCGNTEIQRLRRVTGYLTSDFRRFNAGKIAECLDRVKHSNYTSFAQDGTA